ncbi:hypothetical protein [Archangium violaceum]|uniref:Uncharacterized protein n=1 Tax=Archangium violaceum Cb vi76 TaxID=1406225 RepID=A0A084SHS0_9BACT|nr:hypothetical protein [Archangium violaceum]KFA88005.1 hypothetical protein Q664_43840 [Archangium violaceum Cb vi76]
MNQEPPHLPLLEDPDHPGVFIVNRLGTLTALLIGILCVGMLLAGSFVRLDLPVQGEHPSRTESVSLGTYLARQLGLSKLPGLGGTAP